MKKHSGEKSYKCIQCDYASSHADNLRTHLKTHSGEEKNATNVTMTEAGTLRTYMKIHNGEKFNKCTRCDFASAEEDDLRRHLKTHIEK